jgi:hypothetical protein
LPHFYSGFFASLLIKATSRTTSPY